MNRSTLTADYDREGVEMSLHAIADAFHKIGNEYKHLCSIVPHMSKVQATNIIGSLPIIPFVGKETSVKKELKTEIKMEPEKSKPAATVTTTMTTPVQINISEVQPHQNKKDWQ